MKEEIVDIFNKYIESILDDIHTVLPGQILTYYGHTQRKAQIQLMVKLRNVNNQIMETPPIDDVPVIFPGTKNFSFLFPLVKGDGVLVLFSEASLGAFLNSGTVAVEADDLNRFALTDAIAIPGLWSFSNAPQNTINIIELNEAGQIEINGTTLKLLSGIESFLKGDTWKTNWTTFNTTVQTATSGDTAQNAAGINTIKSAFATFAAQLTNMLSTKIKGE